MANMIDNVSVNMSEIIEIALWYLRKINPVAKPAIPPAIGKIITKIIK